MASYEHSHLPIFKTPLLHSGKASPTDRQNATKENDPNSNSEGDGKFDRVSGSSLGGGTFWGLCRLLTACRSFDEMLELSARGDNAKVSQGLPFCA